MAGGSGGGSFERLDLTPSPRLLEVLGDIPYQPWQCLAELIDNAFDDFLADDERDPSNPPAVQVTLPTPRTVEGGEIVCVSDNGRGMSKEDLERSLRAGYSNKFRYGTLGLFGMGFNIATARLGSLTEVRTTRSGDTDWLVAEIDFRRMERESTFSIPLRREPKDDPGLHGTEVTVRRLRPETRDRLRRPTTVAQVRERLGKVYSYLLRQGNAVRELPEPVLAGRGFGLYVNQTRVRPWLPCVWSPSRGVDYRGTRVPAVIEINRELQPAWACMSCGHWHQHDPERCLKCESENLELRERRVVGWVGLQRYLDKNDFGIDLLRNGRKILMSDKSLFSWEDPDTGDVLLEYPIEFGSTTGGRIVGEIHLDHVPVHYQKNDFERGREWLTAVHIVRGEGPLQPRKAQGKGFSENQSPLGWIFSAYRRNTAGLKRLIPGDGQNPLHERAREWAVRFRQGQADYLTDERWYEAAAEHDRIRTGQADPPSPPPPGNQPGGTKDPGQTPDDLLTRTGLGVSQPATGGGPAPAGPDPRPETEDERFRRYRAAARRLPDLCGDVSLPQLGRRRVVVYETSERLIDANGQETPSLSRSARGELTIFVSGTHAVFRECGRDPRDYAIMTLAEGLRTEARSNDAIARVAADITERLPDQRFTDAALRERVNNLLQSVRETMAPVAADHAAALWACLPISEKEAAERNAGATEPRLVWPEATMDGRFVAHIGAGAVAAIIRGRPDLVLDGIVFGTTWATWPSHDAKARQVERLARRFDALAEFMSSTDAKSRLDLAMVRLVLDILDQETKWEEVE
ncbi:hypothetical protein CcI6DRAFT_03331 [Frankia sp. CcI6]|uniref:ATP-binding protein n=2 Tax=Frankia TaxID=1854 RepID=UPI0003CFCAF4|nr:ATP-binding protein [Frankia sp. CcI6]ETA01208.1 hypothetical protein CcI6DRAFT_03331 [Frankia sp. CcI6]